MRVEQEPAYLLHRRAYRESSALLEAYTPGHGRVGLVQRGAQRPRKGQDRIQPFCRLSLSWSGRGQLFTLGRYEVGPVRIAHDPRATLCGLYLNELLMNLVPRWAHNEELFRCYEDTLAVLGSGRGTEPALRRFEFELLGAIGYGLQLEHEGETGRSIVGERWYRYDNESGPRPCAPGRAGCVSGHTLIALREWRIPDAETLREIKRLLGDVIRFHLQGRHLHTRSIMQYMQTMRHEGTPHVTTR